MSHHGHCTSHGDRGHAGAFDDEQHVRRLEAEARLASGLHQEAARRCGEHLARSAGEVERVLDLGCGPGVATALLAERFVAARVVAVDGSPAMLARAAEIAAEQGVAGRVETRLIDLDGDLAALGTAQLVWAAMALHHVADELATLRAVRQLLDERGLLCVLERPEPATAPHATGLGRYPGLLEAAGFEIVEVATLRDTATAPEDGATRASGAPSREMLIARRGQARAGVAST